jgi:lipoprotein-anchoring transpeptidase ErfK/SrfK
VRPAAPAEPNPPPARRTPSETGPRSPESILMFQIALERAGLSCGSIDGKLGIQTRSAVRAFQERERLPVTGELDSATRPRLVLTNALFKTCEVTTNDLQRIQPLSKTWLGKSQQTALDYESILEMFAERSHAHPELVRYLNPGVDWTNVAAGTVLRLPEVSCTNSLAKAAFVRIRLAEKTLEAFDTGTNLLFHCPCSIAQKVEKRPVGELHVAAVAPRPNYTFDPENFPESPEAQQIKTKLILPPGPNNPVGNVWISLDRPGYGIHGTPGPEQVGRTESHGCFRLANWNAEFLLGMVWVGMPVVVEQ